MATPVLGDEKSNEENVLDLSQSTISSYHFPSLSKLAKNHSPSPILLGETRNYKRLKQVPSGDESIGSEGNFHSGEGRTSTNSLSSLPRLQFRDHIWSYNQRYLAIEAMEEAAAVMMGGEEHKVQEEGSGDEVKLLQLLIACAEAVACRDKAHASTLLSLLRANALVFGTAFQRVASCFVRGLSDRLAIVQPHGVVGFIGPAAKILAFTSEKDEALHLVYEICPQIQFSHFIANASILEAFEGESSVHVVDLSMTLGLPHGHQWRKLIQSLANRKGKPVSCLRNTGVVINSILQLHCVVKESRGALNSVLQKLHELSPKVFVLVEQDSSHHGPFFLGRFMEALHYYSAIFDSLDTMLPRYDTRRAKMEQFFFAEEIKNIVSCEGPARVERHERVDQWCWRMSRARFQAMPLKMITQAKQWLRKTSVCEGHTIVEEKNCLVLGWKSKPIIAASCWKCT
ncbi:hypothetical protein ACB092_03G132500 [Castanea dentata]